VIALLLRQLLRMLRDYPREAFLGAIEEAGRYRLIVVSFLPNASRKA